MLNALNRIVNNANSKLRETFKIWRTKKDFLKLELSKHRETLKRMIKNLNKKIEHGNSHKIRVVILKF
jgi:hypothetical protein